MTNIFFEKQRKNALFIIDCQEKIINPIKNKETILNNVMKLLKAYEILEENIFITEQNPSKLGATFNELIPECNHMVFEKKDFSIGKDKKIFKELKSKGITNIIVCGLETHICVQQTVIDFLHRDYKVLIVADAIGSRNIVDHDIAIQRMVSEGATITSSESIIFELCETSQRKEFKEIINIIKNKLNQ